MTVFGTQSGGENRSTAIHWSSPAGNLWVATENGDHAGLVEFVNGHFSVRSSTGSVVAECSSIPAAKDALAVHLAAPDSGTRSTFNLATSRTFLGRVPRPGYLRGSLAA